MAEEIDETGFYREDFSTDSDWEVFNAQLGEVFQKWSMADLDWGRRLEAGELFRCEWQVKTEILELLHAEVTIKYYIARPKQRELPPASTVDDMQSPMHLDLMSLHNTFGPPFTGQSNELHPLARFYGLRRFVVIHPRQLHQQFLSNPAEFSFFLSSVTVVAGEVCACVPVFVQVYDPKWNYFVGVGLSSTLRTNFDLVALKQSPADCRYLAGLLSIFKEKLPATYVQPATVSVRNTYALDTVQLRISMSVPFMHVLSEDDLLPDSEAAPLQVTKFIALPCGFFPDSRTDVYVIYTWPELSENMAMDSAMRSDFVPSKAHHGRLHLLTRATSYLTSCLHDYLKLNGAKEALEYYVGRNFSGIASGAELPNPLQQLAEPHLRAFRAQRGAHSYAGAQPPKKLAGPMNEHELSEMIGYLFPDFHTNASKFAYAKKGFKQEFDPHRIKSVFPDSLVSRLSCLLATCNAHFGAKSGLAQLWAAFTRELRFIWDASVAVPGVAPGFPDTRTCLLHQKLQMLNVCIERYKIREQGISSGSGIAAVNIADKSGKTGKTDKSEKHDSGSTVDDDDVDDDEENNADKEKKHSEEDKGSEADFKSEEDEGEEEEEEEFYDCSEFEPEGRERPLGDLQLLDCDELLYIPITQDPVPKTEDQLHEDAEVMLKLGPGSGLTTQMMCSSLLSDMEAFKAANPKSKMEDFIRWYSPKDWEETTDDDGNVTGKLSARMLAPGNTWQTVWQQAQPVPVSRQKRLFDETNEALKVLQYLETRNIGEIYELTIVPLLHSAILKVMDILHAAQVLDLFSSQIDNILAALCHLSRDVEIIGQTDAGTIQQTPNPEPLIKQIAELERKFYQYKCFERLCGYPHCSSLEEVQRQYKEMLNNGDSCNIINAGKEGTPEGCVGVGGMLNPSFKNEMRENLISKDYVIRVDGETTSTLKGQAGPQFLRAIVTGEEIRMCGAFTENTTFI